MRDYFFEGQVRLDWGFGNPNVTGALIAMLMIGAWVFAFWGRWGFWLSLVINVALGVFLVQTYSRGGLVALVVGLAPLVWIARRPWSKARLIGVALALLVLGGYAWQERATHRYAKGIVTEDGSVANRWLIYRMAPRMICDAPEGWGWGRSGDAFRQWYQPTGRLENYTHLISTHATWLVEWGWPLRAAYLLAWAAVLALCWPDARSRWLAALMGVLVSFGVSCMFTHVGKEKWLWAGPATALLLVILARLLTRNWPSRRTWSTALVGAVSGLALVVLWAQLVRSEQHIKLRSGIVEIQGSSDAPTRTIGVLQPDHRVLGQFYGQRIREALTTEERRTWSFQVQWDTEAAMGSNLDTLVVSGDAAKVVGDHQNPAIASARVLLLLNPSEPSAKLAELLPKLSRVHQVSGQMWGGTSRYLWEALLSTHAGATSSQLPMSSLFIQRWTNSLVIPELPKKSS
jgi:hypothetical protein